MDEPESGMDAESKAMFRDILIEEVDREQIGVLFSGHDLADVERMCNSVTMMEAGEVFAQKSVNEFMESVQKWKGILPQKTTDDKLFAMTDHAASRIGDLSEFYTVGERELWNSYPELFNPVGVCLDEIPYVSLERMVSMTVIAAFIAQAVRLLVQETQNRTEVLCIFPVKSRNLLTCHYLSGLLMVGIPLLMQAAIIFMLHYSLLIVCKKVTNHVPGTICSFVVVEFAMEILAGYCLGMYWNKLAEDSILNWVFWAVATVILILLSYIADRKKDYARNGFYAFPIAHWVIMGTVFGEIYFIFYGVYGDIPIAVSFLVAIAVSILITTGVHFVTKPKKYKGKGLIFD